MYILRTSEAQLKHANAIAKVNLSIPGILMLLFLVRGADWTYAEDSCINEVARKSSYEIQVLADSPYEM